MRQHYETVETTKAIFESLLERPKTSVNRRFARRNNSNQYFTNFVLEIYIFIKTEPSGTLFLMFCKLETVNYYEKL